MSWDYALLQVKLDIMILLDGIYGSFNIIILGFRNRYFNLFISKHILEYVTLEWILNRLPTPSEIDQRVYILQFVYV